MRLFSSTDNLQKENLDAIEQIRYEKIFILWKNFHIYEKIFIDFHRIFISLLIMCPWHINWPIKRPIKRSIKCNKIS